MSVIPKPATPRYACREAQPSQPQKKQPEPWTFLQKLVLCLLIAAIAFLLGIQVGRNAEKEEARYRTTTTYLEDIG